MATDDLRVDWNNDGDFNDTGENVTARVLARDPVQVRYGRDQARAGSPTAVGEMSFSLNNISRDYSPENGSSPLAGNLRPGRPVKYERTHSAVTYSMFRGHLDDFQVIPAPLERAVQFTCMDVLGRLREARISTALYHGISTGQAIGIILDEIGWPAASRDLDTGATTIRWWWEEGTDAWEAVNKVVQSEGPAALVTVGSSGEFVFRDRHHRLTSAASTTSQATFRDTGAEPKFSAPFTYDHGWRDIVNSARFTVDDRSPLGELSDVWTSDQTLSIPSGGSVSVVASTSDPFYGAITPVSGTDYQVVSGTVTAHLSRDSGASTTITYSATGGAGVVNTLQLRAFSVPVRVSVQVGTDEPGSISNHGLRSYQQDAPWAGVWDAQALADLIVGHRYERLPIVSFRVTSGSTTGTATRLTQQLARDLSDRVTVVDSETGLNGDFYIEQIAHTVAQAGRVQDTVFGCEKVATLPTSVMILDTGLLGTNTLGAIGLDDPDTLFITDAGLLGTERLAY